MPSAGDIIRAADVGHTIHEARCTANTSLTTDSYVDVTGATVTFTTSKDDVEVTVVMFADVSRVTTGYSFVLAALNVDGVRESEVAVAGPESERVTVGQVYRITLATAGSHTLKAQARLGTASGEALVSSTHTGFVATVYDVTT